MKYLTYLLFISCCFTACSKKVDNSTSDSISSDRELVPNPEANADWVSIFNGENFDGWHGFLEDEVAEHWSVEDGAMMFTPPAERTRQLGYDILTDNTYTNFALSLEWKISPCGNSGIFWGVKEEEKYGATYATGPEIQVLDNTCHPDAKQGGGTHTAGSLYDMIAPPKDVTKPAGEWNKCVISINQDENQAMVWLNGEKIQEFPLHGEEWDAMIKDSKFNGWDGFGEFKTGHIAFQDHNDKVWYRNIMIQQL